jgi:hypothetical protein
LDHNIDKKDIPYLWEADLLAVSVMIKKGGITLLVNSQIHWYKRACLAASRLMKLLGILRWITVVFGRYWGQSRDKERAGGRVSQTLPAYLENAPNIA